MTTLVLSDGTKVNASAEWVNNATEKDLLELEQLNYDRKGIKPSAEEPYPIERPTGRINAKSIAERQEQPFPGRPITPESDVLKSGVVQGGKQMLKEAALPTAGAAIGAGLGTLTSPLTGPVGPLMGASAGSFAGEKLNQVLGITPESSVAQGVAGIAPFIGPLGAKAFQKVIARPVGFVTEKMPITQIARANATMRQTVPELENIGARILSERKGIKAVPAGRLYNAVEKSGITVPAAHFKTTRDTVGKLVDELGDIKAFPEARAALQHITQVHSALKAGGDPVSFAHLVKMRQQLGAVVRQAEKASGVRLGSAKTLFKSLENDLDMLSRSRGNARVPAKLLKRASERAKLEFAVSDMEDAVARFTTVGADRVSLDVGKLRGWVKDITNPKNKGQYSKNFTDALRKDLPKIEKRLEELHKITEKFGAGPAGPGSIVVRGIGATTGRSVVGAIFGYGAGSAVGLPAPLAAVGGILGASLPEAMVGLLSSPRLLNSLNRAANLGKGEISLKTWAVLSSFALSAAQPRDRSATTIRSIKGTAKEQNEDDRISKGNK